MVLCYTLPEKVRPSPFCFRRPDLNILVTQPYAPAPCSFTPRRLSQPTETTEKTLPSLAVPLTIDSSVTIGTNTISEQYYIMLKQLRQEVHRVYHSALHGALHVDRSRFK